MNEAADAKLALLKLHGELLQENPSSAASLAWTAVPTGLNRSLSSTNGIESSFSVVERICEQVQRWQGSDHRLRSVASPCCSSNPDGIGFTAIATCRCWSTPNVFRQPAPGGAKWRNLCPSKNATSARREICTARRESESLD
jgi:hypothetical protein